MRLGLGSILTCLFSLACGPVVVLPGDGDGAGSVGSDDTTSSGTTTAVTATTTPTATTAGTIATTAGSTGASEDDDVDDDGISWDCGAAPPGSMHHCTAPQPCDPPMRGVLGWISVDGGAGPDDPMPEPYVYECTIPDWTEESSLYSFALSCADGPHTLEIASSVGIWFDTAGDFLLSVTYSNDFESSNRLVALRRADGELVLAGASTSSPEEATSDFFEPLAVSLVEGLCPIDPPEDVFLGPCYSVERQALTFILDTAVEQVFDHGVGELSPYVVIVQHAEQRHDLTCSDIPDAAYTWIVVPPIPD